MTADGWSGELKNLTREMWQKGEILFLRDGKIGLAFKNFNDEFGYVEMNDILEKRIIIRSWRNRSSIISQYNDIEDAIKDGWVVD